MANRKGNPNWGIGKSGNPKGRPPEEESLTWLMRQFLKTAPEGQKKTYKDILIEKVYHKAVKEGDPTCIKLVWNYLDGMPKQSHELTGADGKDLFPQPILDVRDVRKNNSNKESPKLKETN